MVFVLRPVAYGCYGYFFASAARDMQDVTMENFSWKMCENRIKIFVNGATQVFGFARLMRTHAITNQ